MKELHFKTLPTGYDHGRSVSFWDSLSSKKQKRILKVFALFQTTNKDVSIVADRLKYYIKEAP